MNNHQKQQSLDDRDVDEQQKPTEGSSSVLGDDTRTDSGKGIGLADRLTGLFVGDGDNDDDHDLLTERTVMQWLQALDLHVIGACRADERLKPLLKVNVSAGVAEDRFLSNLSQHFELSEVGLLARCLCVPLVSVRVGKVDKQGSLLVPNSVRGNLTLSLLPTSDLRISFLGDDGRVERLSTLRNISDCSSVVIEGISADNSGRSFMIKVPTTANSFYFWCSEKSTLLGYELLDKMKNLLKTKPSLADLTGIGDSRLECFLTHFQTYHVGSSTQVNNTALVSLTGCPSTSSIDLGKTGKSSQAASLASKSSLGRILSPRSSSFKEGPPRNLVALKTVREKFRRKEEVGNFSSVNTLSVSSPNCTNIPTLNQSFNAKIPESAIDTHMFPLVNGLEVDLNEKTFDTPALSTTPPNSLYSCWCSPVASTLQYTVAPSHMMSMSMAEPFTLPLLASLPSGSIPRSSLSLSSLSTPEPSINLNEIPPFLPEPMVRLPISVPTSQQIPFFTPLMTDPIVHIPVIDISSSGQAYLVSAGPAINVTIPPLHQALMSPLIQKTDSMAEKSARDTLRMLISGSSQLPLILANVDGNQNMLASSGSRGLYGDVKHALGNSIAAMGLVSLTEKSSGVMRKCHDQGDLVGETVDSGGTCSTNDNLDLGAGKCQ